MNNSAQYTGHLPNGNPVQAHSAGEVYPAVLYATVFEGDDHVYHGVLFRGFDYGVFKQYDDAVELARRLNTVHATIGDARYLAEVLLARQLERRAARAGLTPDTRTVDEETVADDMGLYRDDPDRHLSAPMLARSKYGYTKECDEWLKFWGFNPEDFQAQPVLASTDNGTRTFVDESPSRKTVGGIDSNVDMHIANSYVEALNNSNIFANDGSDVHARSGSTVTASAGSFVRAYAGSNVVARKGSTVYAQDGSNVFAEEGSTVHARSGSTVTASAGSFVLAYAGSNVVARKGSVVYGYKGSVVRAYEGSTVYAFLGSTAYAEEGSTVYAQDGSNVFAKEGSTVHAYEGSTVHAEEGSNVVAHKGSTVFAKEGSTVNALGGSTVHNLYFDSRRSENA